MRRRWSRLKSRQRWIRDLRFFFFRREIPQHNLTIKGIIRIIFGVLVMMKHACSTFDVMNKSIWFKSSYIFFASSPHYSSTPVLLTHLYEQINKRIFLSVQWRQHEATRLAMKFCAWNPDLWLHKYLISEFQPRFSLIL